MERQAEGISCVLALLEVAPMPASRPLLRLAAAPNFSGRTDPLGRVPDAHAVVPVAGGQPLAVRAPDDLRVEAGVPRARRRPAEDQQLLPGEDVPNGHLIPVHRHQQTAVGAERNIARAPDGAPQPARTGGSVSS